MNLEFKESDLELIKLTRKKIQESISNSKIAQLSPDNVKKGFAVLKKDGKVYYIDKKSENYPLLKKLILDTTTKHLCTKCPYAYADKCPKVAAKNAAYGKCIENFNFILDGIETISGTNVSPATGVRDREYFIVSNCNYKK